MSKTIYLLGIFIAALFGWGSLIIVIYKLSPFLSTKLAFSLFYSSLFISLSTSLALVGYFLRILRHKYEIYFSHITVSLRQGVLLSVMICVAVFFQSMRVLTWWDGVLLLLLAVFIEFYFMGRKV